MVKSTAKSLDGVFYALSDATRRSILHDVSKGAKTVGEVAMPYKMSLAAVSKHIAVLEQAALIERKKRGSFRVVSLNPAGLKIAEEWLAYYQRFWQLRLDSLQHFLEEGKP